MKTKRSLGQYFLKSERALSKIVEAGDIKTTDTILEIGPGTGTLTEKLLATGARVIAIEKDDGLYELLKEKFKREIQSGQLALAHDDILNFKLTTKSYKLIANIPYNITGAILKKFLEAENKPEKIVFLVQKEVAERIVRNCGRLASTKESVLSISVKAYGTPRYIETVKAGSFAPMPKVDSAIIAIENINRGRLASTEEEFFKIVKAGFKSKRKKLSSNLSTIFLKPKIQETFKKLGLDENIRAEDVNVETWKKLTELLTN